jgi:hypothetical protein
MGAKVSLHHVDHSLMMLGGFGIFLLLRVPFRSSQLSRSSSTLKLQSPVDVLVDLYITFVGSSSTLALAS